MGLDDGRLGGSAVVDINTKVYGTDNLFVVDASIFPGHVTGNPSAAIVTVAERAFERISSLHAPVLGKEGAQCGGNAWTGSFQCDVGLQCNYVDPALSRVSQQWGREKEQTTCVGEQMLTSDECSATRPQPRWCAVCACNWRCSRGELRPGRRCGRRHERHRLTAAVRVKKTK